MYQTAGDWLPRSASASNRAKRPPTGSSAQVIGTHYLLVALIIPSLKVVEALTKTLYPCFRILLSFHCISVSRPFLRCPGTPVSNLPHNFLVLCHTSEADLFYRFPTNSVKRVHAGPKTRQLLLYF